MLSNIPFIASPNHFAGRFGYTPKFLILHGTAGGNSAQGIANYFATAASQVSSHYVVDQAGNVVQCVAESDGAWANGVISGPPGIGGDGVHHDAWWDSVAPNPNYVTISIEHCKAHDDNSDQLTDAQKSASFALVLDICERNGIPMRAADSSGGITGHYSMDPVNRSRCPGAYPWNALYDYLANNGGTTMSDVPQGWRDDGKVLTAPNGHTVVQGFRSYIESVDWNAANVPLEQEHNVSGVPGTRQVFLCDALVWTPQTGVSVGSLGQWYIDALTQIAADKAQIETLETQLAAAKAAQTTNPMLPGITTDLQVIAASAQDALSKLKAS